MNKQIAIIIIFVFSLTIVKLKTYIRSRGDRMTSNGSYILQTYYKYSDVTWHSTNIDVSTSFTDLHNII